MDRDIQSELGMTATLGDIAVVSASVPDTETHTTPLDTKGMRGAMFGLEWTSVLTAGDVIQLNIIESDTSGGTYTVVSTDKMLPSRRKDSDGVQLAVVTGPTAPYVQTIGAFGTKRFVKVQAVASVLTADETAAVRAVFRDEFRPVERWDPDYTSVDGNP